MPLDPNRAEPKRPAAAPVAFDIDAALAKPEPELSAWIRWPLAIVWYGLAGLLFLSAVVYILIQARIGMSPLFVVGIFLFAFMLPLLFLGEGSEVAIAMLIDKDPDQFSRTLQPSFVRLCRSGRQNPPTFIIGRQLIVVAAVVMLTFLSDNLAELPTGKLSGLCGAVAAAPGLHTTCAWMAWLVRAPGFVLAFAILFPTLVALWIAQLPAKFIAHQYPLWTYSWLFTRLIVLASVIVGSRLQVERLSVALSRWLLGFQADQPEKLLPGRRNHFEISALLRGGRALKKAEINIIVQKDGSAKVRESFEFHALAECLQQIPQRTYWETPYASFESVEFTKWPEGIGEKPSIPGKPKPDPEIKDGETLYALEWDLELPSALPAGSVLAFDLNYTTGPGAMKTKPRELDDYFYNVYQVPTEEVLVHIVPAPDAPFILLRRPVSAEASEEEKVNKREAELVSVAALEDGGLHYRIRYPLLNTRFVFNWAVARRSGYAARTEPSSRLARLVAAAAGYRRRRNKSEHPNAFARSPVA